MRKGSRVLREWTLHVLAGLGLILALSVMAVVFAVPASQGDEDGLYMSSADSEGSDVGAHAKRIDLDGGFDPPSGVGVLLGVLVLGGGVTVLVIGARREPVLQPHHQAPIGAQAGGDHFFSGNGSVAL